MIKLKLRNKQLTNQTSINLTNQANTKATKLNQLTKLNHQNNQPITNGFTIIEVALVLAIAAMIFLVVFLAVPALQRNQRDDARKRDVSNVVAAIESYYGNSGNGGLTSTWAGQDSGGFYYYDANGGGPIKSTKLGPYLDTLSKNTQRVVSEYAKVDRSLLSMANDQGGYINIVLAARCDGSSGVKVASSRSAAVVVQLESGSPSFNIGGMPDSNAKFYCQDAS